MRVLITIAQIVLILILCAVAFQAWAHEWYPSECCHSRDCAPMPSSDVEITPQGYRIKPTGELIPFGQERTTPPEGGGLFHRCTYSDGTTRIQDGKLCLYVPEFGG